jgi:Domain of unknown function (DUF4437)
MTKHAYLLLLGSALCAAGCGRDAAADADSKQLVQIPASSLKWTPFFPGGPEDAFVIGSRDAKQGPTAFFFKMKAGFDSGWHTHESAYRAVVLAGTVIETSKGSEAPKPLGPGSYYFQPAVVHKTACAKGADCLTYIYEDGRFSFTPTTEDGKPIQR